MLILALDTSGETCSIAVSDGAICRVEYSFLHRRHLTERLPGIVEFVLRDADVTLREIEAFAVGRGPGSFTGVRVGVTMAKVWAMTLDKPVVGVSSLDVLAEPFLVSAKPRIAIAPTRRKESLVAFYQAGSLLPVRTPVVLTNATILEAAQNEFGTATEYLLVGETAGAIIRNESFSEEWLRPCNASVSAAVVAKLAHADLVNGVHTDVDTLIPLYVTPPPTG